MMSNFISIVISYSIETMHWLFLFVSVLLLTALILIPRCSAAARQFSTATTVLSPAYGTVQAIKTSQIDTVNGPTNYTHIIIFLSPFDNHDQYYPADAIVDDQVHDYTGRFHLAFQLNKSDMNEKTITTLQPIGRLQNRLNGNPIIVQRIAGLIARRITTEHAPGYIAKKGQYMGSIKFGSRVDVIMPTSGVDLLVGVGEKVYGGKTPVARY